jgi:peroxiredoxin Q/BCP
LENQSLREGGELIRTFDVAYFAASIDLPETNRQFAESLELDFPILSDPSKEVARAYGVLRAFGLYAARRTFFIGEDGRVLHVEQKVRPRSAGGDVASRLAELGVRIRRG